jgi:hypothetical protein
VWAGSTGHVRQRLGQRSSQVTCRTNSGRTCSDTGPIPFQQGESSFHTYHIRHMRPGPTHRLKYGTSHVDLPHPFIRVVIQSCTNRCLKSVCATLLQTPVDDRSVEDIQRKHCWNPNVVRRKPRPLGKTGHVTGTESSMFNVLWLVFACSRTCSFVPV